RSKVDEAGRKSYELEAELLPDGTVEDLRELARVFAGEYGLKPQALSKFEQALVTTGLGRSVGMGFKPASATQPIAIRASARAKIEIAPTAKQAEPVSAPADAQEMEIAQP